MIAPAYGNSSALLDTPVHQVWKGRHSRSVFGDVAVVVFLLTQCFDGIFTYVGVMSFGIGIEANPIIAELMTSLGHGKALILAKCFAAALGIALHIGRVHTAVALLAAFYVTAAVLPWAAILFA